MPFVDLMPLAITGGYLGDDVDKGGKSASISSSSAPIVVVVIVVLVAFNLDDDSVLFFSCLFVALDAKSTSPLNAIRSIE